MDFTINDYERGAHQAFDAPTHHSKIKSGTIYNAIHNNCAGKPKGYISENYPV